MTKSSGNLELFAGISAVSDKGLQNFSFFEWETTTNKEITNIVSPVSSELADRIDDMQSDKPGGKVPAISSEFLVTDFINLKDGSTYVVMEMNMNGPDVSMAYLSEGMIVLKINDHKFQWINFIPKKQYSSEFTNFIYHKVITKGNQFSIIHNEIENNIDFDIVNSKKAPKRYHDYRDLFLMKVDFSEDGKMNRSVIIEPSTYDTSIDIKVTSFTNKQRLILSGIRISGITTRNAKLGIMSLE